MVCRMDAKTSQLVSRLAVAAVLIAAFWAAMGCTVIRYVDDDDGSTNGPPPVVIDMLVVMDLSRGAANLTEPYANIIGTVLFALGEQNVQVRQAGLAPMYARAAGAVPLVYGENGGSEFNNFAEAIAFYTYDDGAMYLQDDAASDSANIATLGQNLDTQPLYNPTVANPGATAYFLEPADGFVVLYLSASPRRCDVDDPACAVNNENPASYFTGESAEGAAWLELPGGTSLPPDKIFHAAIVTAENTDYDTFYQQCAAYPNFPAALLDVMEPSEEHAYFGPFVDGVKNQGGAGDYVDLCEAMSSRSEPALLGMAAKIRAMF